MVKLIAKVLLILFVMFCMIKGIKWETSQLTPEQRKQAEELTLILLWNQR